MRLLILLLLIGLPVIEITLFIKVGGLLGVLPTILLIFGMSVLGTWLLRQQGLQSLGKMQSAMARGEMPMGDMLDGFILVLAGLLFILPGFFTDILGFALLLPPIRKAFGAVAARWLAARSVKTSFYAANSYQSHKDTGGPIIEGEATEVDPDTENRHRLPPRR
ncbi:MAG: FxsA family protein [Parvibaculum sp.]|nr:FxsA family protein [Parvibaculum sp.]